MRATWNVERLAVHLRLEQVADQIITGPVEVVVDLRLEVLEQLAHAEGALLHRLVDPFEHVVHEPTEAVAVGLGQAEHRGDHPDRDVLRIADRGVHHVDAAVEVGPQRGHQLLAVGTGRRFETVDGLRGERRQEDSTRPLVERRVGRDRRGDSLGREFEWCPELAHDDAAGRKPVGVVRDGRDVLVAGRQPRAVVPLGVGDGARRTQLVPDAEGIGDVGVVGVVEVGRPVDDRLVAAHQGSSRMASSGQFSTASSASWSRSGGTTPSPMTTPLPMSSGSKRSLAML